jgi:nicotinamide-nucleotide amidase
MGTAPGMLFKHGEATLISMPGVPFEMMHIFNAHIVPLVKQRLGDSVVIAHKTIMTYGQGETFLAEMMGDLATNIPVGLSIAYLPSLGFVRIRITGKGDQSTRAKVDAYADCVAATVMPHIYGYDDESPQQAILRLAKQKDLTLSTAESCTGGRLGHVLTSVAGSSAYYVGGVVSYSNALKQTLLGVSQDTLSTHGAVSEQTVIEMAEGANNRLGSEVAISISGIAGPEGGSPEKPVGTIWIGLAQQGKPTEAIKINATKDRLKNIEYATNVAMGRLLKRLMQV